MFCCYFMDKRLSGCGTDCVLSRLVSSRLIVVCWPGARPVKASMATSHEKSFDKNEVEANLNINGYPRKILVPDIAVLAE